MLALLNAQGGMTFTLGSNDASSSLLVTNPNSDPLFNILGDGRTTGESSFYDDGGAWLQPVGFFNHGITNRDGVGIMGQCANTDWYGVGVHGVGNYMGVYGLNMLTGTAGNDYYGGYFVSSVDAGEPTGVKGHAYGGETATGVYGYGYYSDYSFGGQFYGSYANNYAYGVWAEGYSSYSNYGLAAWAYGADDSGGFNCGVYGSGTGDGYNNYGIYGYAADGINSNWAGYFYGDVYVAGTLSKAAGSFKIDHPLDPENKYLSHSFVESPDMMNIYNGNVILDNSGEADVELPEWFEVLNRDFRYQLTAIGGPGPNLYISEEIDGNRFKIAGGSPGMKVSWQLTGIRQDAYANAHRIEVEENKTGKDIGNYLHAKELGYSNERLINADLINQKNVTKHEMNEKELRINEKSKSLKNSQ